MNKFPLKYSKLDNFKCNSTKNSKPHARKSIPEKLETIGGREKYPLKIQLI